MGVWSNICLMYSLIGYVMVCAVEAMDEDVYGISQYIVLYFSIYYYILTFL